MLNGKSVGAVIPAAGSGRRMGGVPKQFMEIQGKPLLLYTLEIFQHSPLIDKIVVAGPAESLDAVREIGESNRIDKLTAVVCGGEHRQDSVWQGIQALPPESVEFVVVHDAARPFVTAALLAEVLAKAEELGGSIAAVPSSDTVKVADDLVNVSQTIDRNIVWFAQTPQAFRRERLIAAYQRAHSERFYGTDEASLLEHAGFPVGIVKSSRKNMKITTPDDIAYLEFLAKSGEM